jgi:plastocyanin
MKIKKIIFIAIFAFSLVALLVTFSGCTSSAAATTNTSAATTSTSAAATSTVGTNPASKNEILIQSNSFSPDNLSIKVGDTVTWTNKDSYNHTVTAKNGEFDSGNMASGGTFSFTFSKEGTYEYICGIHTFMKGTINVTK